MAQRALRFGIHDGTGRRAATWKLWTETSGGKSDLYLVCRRLGGILKASLHQSGNWHIAYSPRAFEEYVEGAIPKFENRFIEKWSRPAEIAPGLTLAFRIVTPYSAVTKPTDIGHHKGVKWLPNAPVSKATQIDIIITKGTMPAGNWPGKQSMGTSLIGSFTLENGETVWAVYWIVDMPDLSRLPKGTPHFYRGRSEKDLESDGLRMFLFDTEPDGSRVIYDFTVDYLTHSAQKLQKGKCHS